MIIYLDTSALLKRYVQEKSSELVMALLDGMHLVGTSLLTYVEMASALRRSVSQELLPLDEAKAAWNDFLSDWDSMSRLNVSTQVTERAASQAWQYNLRRYDAMHLASALIWQETLSTSILLATFDHQLWQAAQQTGLSVWPDKT